MNYVEREKKLSNEMLRIQGIIDSYKENIKQLEKTIKIQEEDYIENIQKSREDSMKNDILGHNYYLLDKYKKMVIKYNKKLEKLLPKLNAVTLKIHNSKR